MGKRKQAASANSIEAPSAINKRTRQESKRSDSQKREDESKSEPPSLSQTNSTSSKTEKASTTGEVVAQTTILATTAATTTTTTATVAVPKPLPRIVVPAGLVPRQIARPKGVITATKTITATSHGSLKSSTTGSSSSPLSTKSSSRSGSISTTTTTTTTGAGVSTSTSTQPSRTAVFRAKDIIQQLLPSLPDSLPSARRSVARVSTSVSTSVTMDAAGQPTMNTMIRADPIIVYPEKYPNRREYPYGNYPSYYETRIDEQTKDVKSNDPVTKSTTSDKPNSTPPTLKTTPRANPSSLSAFKGKALVTDLPFQTQPRGKSHRIWKRTLSVLFPPPPDSFAADSDGVAVHGETSRPAMTLSELAKKVDIRFEFLDPSWFRGKKVLDIGCNSALLTIFIAVHYKPCKIQGVDIDPSLIGKAQSFILKTFSQISSQAYKQQTRHREDTQDMTTTTTTTGDDDVPYEEYFPRALHKIHGFLPVPPRRPETEKLFPHNIELRVADWATETGNKQEAEGEQWDVILAFSLTKWIHLHGGDAGLKAFFQKIYRSLSPGGIMLLEPQAFETYNKRSKILPEMTAAFKSIQFKPDQFQAYLLGPEVGFKDVVHLGHSEGSAKNFNRDIFLYRK